MQTELQAFYCPVNRKFDTVRYEASIFGEQIDLFEVCASPAHVHMGINTFEREKHQALMYPSESDDEEESSIMDLDEYHFPDMTASAPAKRVNVFNMPYSSVISRRCRTA